MAGLCGHATTASVLRGSETHEVANEFQTQAHASMSALVACSAFGKIVYFYRSGGPFSQRYPRSSMIAYWGPYCAPQFNSYMWQFHFPLCLRGTALDVDCKASEFAALKVPWRQAATSSPSLEFSRPTSDATNFA